ncbi:PQQ-dependent sugar dehydrogenase [Algibacter sp. AS12]|uniref:PQQ-dependent sugar dehydrogenase n=1 Tax=Algibacter sp. AS12 TaxID=3135773 RepID=UPI00398B8F94
MKSLTFLITCCFYSTILLSQSVNLVSFASGFSQPVEISITNTVDDSRLFIIEKSGVIKILNENGSVNTTPFLDISSRVGAGRERGLLGLAFAPDYASTGRFYVNYTDNTSTGKPNTIIARYTVSSNPDIANTNGTTLLSYQQPFGNHNGGKIAFGPDGFLYIAVGDGGSSGDPSDRAQSTSSLFGKLLRIDVSGNLYSIPSTNPYAASANEPTDPRPEIYAIGLRNPWKFSFDKNNGDLWIADVGQYLIEEINRVNGSGTPGDNYGWRCFEGSNPFNDQGNCPTGGINSTIKPIAEYNHSGGKCSITGGYIYRGSTFSSFTGKYFFADYCSGEIGLLTNTEGNWSMSLQTPTNKHNWTTFGEDINGELYIAGGSTVYKIQDPSLSTTNVKTTDHFKMFPNPSEDYIKIDLTKNYNQVNTITILNINGQNIKTITKPNQKTITHSTKNYAQGLYFIEITTKDHSKAIKKLMIN